MKIPGLLVLLGLLAPVLAPLQEKSARPAQDGAKPARKKNPVSAFFEGEGERLATEVEGSWTLFEYFDPLEAPDSYRASGFATFHDGFLTLILSIDTAERHLFGLRRNTLIHTGAYRYRFDEQAFLQLSVLLSFSNETDEGDLEREPSGQAFEYYAQVDDGLLELRNPEGIRLSFRKLTAGDFPDSAIRKLESRRSNTEHWEVEDENRER